MKFKTVYKGEKAIVINRNGAVEQIEGPKRVFLLLSRLEKLKNHIADLNEYLVIEYVNGQIEHKPGPVNVWFNRFEHNQIRLKTAFKLDESQLIIVYNRDPATNQVNRRIVRGPCVYVPLASEWLHEFVWHAEDKNHAGHVAFVPNGVKFNILKTKPDFLNYNVREVRTLDDTLITVKIMLIYELVDVNLMLDKTQDPISDFINAICADVVCIVSQLTFTQFLQESSKRLNEIASYEQLNHRAARAGYKIVFILYNGYTSSDALQEMQDSAIQSRTNLRLTAEIEKQNNELANLMLESEKKRFAMENELNQLKSTFEKRLDEARASFKLDMKKSEHAVDFQVKDFEATCERQLEQMKNKTDEEYLETLHHMKVDLNKYECELNRAKNKNDRVYEIVN